MAGKTVALCYAPEDLQLGPAVQGVKAALDAWEVAWTDVSVLAEPEARAVVGRAQALVRLCSPAIERSPAATSATGAFRKRLARDKRLILVNLVLDTDYQHDPRDADRLYITTAGKTRARWLEELAIPLGVATIAQRVSRRALIGMGVGFGVAALASGGAAVLFEQQRQAQAGAASITVTHSSGQPRWSAQLGAPSTDLYDVPLVCVDGGTVYSYINGQLTAFDMASGASRRVTLGFPVENYQGETQSPSGDVSSLLKPVFNVVGDDLFIRGAFRGSAPTNPSDLTVASLKTGQARWRLELEEYFQPLVAGGAAVFFAFIEDPTGRSGAFTLRAHRLSDGHPLWVKAVVPDFGDEPVGAQQPMLAVDGQRVYASSVDHTMRAFDLATGRPLWSYRTGGETFTPAVAGGTVYVGSADYTVSALDAATGKLRWRYLTGGGVSCAPLVNGPAVYVASQDGYVYALDAAAGALYWRAYAGQSFAQSPGDAIAVSPVVYRTVLVAAWRSTLFAYDVRTGHPLWTYAPVASPPSLMSAQPVMAGGLVVFGAPGKQVFAINP